MKSIAYGLGKAKDQENGQSYGSNVGPRFFCGVNFLGLVALDETMPHMSRDHESWAVDHGNHVMVPNPSEMISITTTMIKVNAQMPKP